MRAREAIQEANEALTRARDLASQAAKAAKEIAAQRSREADRLSARAREQAAAADRRVTEASRMKMAGADASSPKAPPPDARAEVTLREGHYQALTKEQLLRLAGEFELEGEYAMNKQELIEALGREGGVPLGALSKEELLRVARRADCDVVTSMTKDDLIGAVTASTTS